MVAKKANESAETFVHDVYGEKELTTAADKVQARNSGWLPKGEKRTPVKSNLPTAKKSKASASAAAKPADAAK